MLARVIKAVNRPQRVDQPMVARVVDIPRCCAGRSLSGGVDEGGLACVDGWGILGSPIVLRELLYDPERSLIEQSRRHAPDMAVPNGDGTGLGWYGQRPVPALFRSANPAWGDESLRELSAEISSPLFLAHVRAGTGTPVQQTNCHPFRFGKWLFVHNGYVSGFGKLRRQLLLTVRPVFFDNIQGSTDSEVLFHLALTFGLADDPLGGLQRMAGFVEAVGAAAGIAEPLADDRWPDRR